MTSKLRELNYISPSTFEILRGCRLRMAFSLGSRKGLGNPYGWLGDICHSALEALVRSRSIFQEEWPKHLALAWDAALAGKVQDLSGSGSSWGAPSTWPGFQLKKARLKNATGRLRELLLELPSDAELLPEVDLQAEDGKLRGRADLVVRSKSAGVVLDYKTGRVFDTELGVLRASYVRQLQLYAYMEHEVFGEWPARGAVVPLDGPIVDALIDPAQCRELARQALEVLDRFRQELSNGVSHLVSLVTCPMCPHAVQCEPFWRESPDAMGPEFLAARGVVTELVPSALGRLNVRLGQATGTVATPELLIRNVDPIVGAQLQVGSLASAVGLRLDERRDCYELGGYGRIAPSSLSEATAR